MFVGCGLPNCVIGNLDDSIKARATFNIQSADEPNSRAQPQITRLATADSRPLPADAFEPDSIMIVFAYARLIYGIVFCGKS